MPSSKKSSITPTLFKYGTVACLAYSFGRLVNQPVADTSPVLRRLSVEMPEAKPETNRPNFDDGWKSIDVYYGKPKLINNQPHKGIYFSQVNQDKIILSLLSSDGNFTVEGASPSQTNGFFLDLAANDASDLSNTYTLERYFNWTGLCFEPNPAYWYNHGMARPNSKTIGGVVMGNRLDGEPGETVQFRFDNGALGGIVGRQFDNKQIRQNSNTVGQHTVSFLATLKRYNVPSIVDYLSLDVEGAESLILDDKFPFHEYKFKILTVERPKPDLVARLEKNNYRKVGMVSSWGETLWVERSFETELNIAAASKFMVRMAPVKADSS